MIWRVRLRDNRRFVVYGTITRPVHNREPFSTDDAEAIYGYFTYDEETEENIAKIFEYEGDEFMGVGPFVLHFNGVSRGWVEVTDPDKRNAAVIELKSRIGSDNWFSEQ